jgi:hypothetical protein
MDICFLEAVSVHFAAMRPLKNSATLAWLHDGTGSDNIQTREHARSKDVRVVHSELVHICTHPAKAWKMFHQALSIHQKFCLALYRGPCEAKAQTALTRVTSRVSA